MAKMIRVPKVPRSAFDPTRPASSLLKSHVQQLQAAVFGAIATEAHASEAIRALTKLMQALRPLTVPRSHGHSLHRRSRKGSRKSRRHTTRSRK